MPISVEKIKNLPARPGVYLFRNAPGEIIYVGKAVSLKNRVRSYFHAGAGHSPKVSAMLEKADSLDYIMTDSELEALILESNLIKEHRPRYNVLLKDDKSYPYLKVTLAEDFPRLHITRRLVEDGSRYFGPYTQLGAVHETLDVLRRVFPFRSCKDRVLQQKSRPCLNYHINRCVGPCSGQVGREEYRAMIGEICLFLEGRQEELVKRLAVQMADASSKMEYERAAKLRDRIRALEKVQEKQKVVMSGAGDRDVVALAGGDGKAVAAVFYIRGGRLLGRENFVLEGAGGTQGEEVMAAFLKQHYSGAEFVPGEILVSSVFPDEARLIGRWLAKGKGAAIKIKVPGRGEKKRLLDLVEKNARLALEEVLATGRQDFESELEELAGALELTDIPRRIECFDISSIQGAEAVASMVVFENGRPAPGQYRRFKIKTVAGPDDYACMREVVARRFSRRRTDQEHAAGGRPEKRLAAFDRLPDLLIVDGGRGQLSAAREAVAGEGMESIPLFALAKEEEAIYRTGSDLPLILPEKSGALHLLQRVRDEAHRFAVAYHRQLRTKRNLKSLLDEIEGIGPVRRKELLKAFSGLDDIERASPEQLAAVPGMNRAAAAAVHDFFRKGKGRGE